MNLSIADNAAPTFLGAFYLLPISAKFYIDYFTITEVQVQRSL